MAYGTPLRGVMERHGTATGGGREATIQLQDTLGRHCLLLQGSLTQTHTIRRPNVQNMKPCVPNAATFYSVG